MTTCVLSATFLGPDGEPIYRLPVEVGPSLSNSAAYVAGGSFVGGKQCFYTDKDGVVTFSLVRGMPFSVRIGTRSDVLYEFTCPDLATADLFDYIFPHPVLVSFESAAYSIAVGNALLAKVYVTYSNGVQYLLRSGLTLASSNTSIFFVTGRTAYGVSAGVANLRIDTVDEKRFPARPDIFGLPCFFVPSTYTIGPPSTITVT